ncbi:sporulation protein Cse60 [Limosilactobacillus mucosae]|uniref:sporulation protein Cse60 n=1 Tax=Limosilactobacillus mucosae TaxID=97478 RepID=UPI003EB8D483
MIKTKTFFEGYTNPNIDIQINKWLTDHPDYIVVDVKFNSIVVDADDGVNYSVFRDALVIYREYENV